MRVDMVEILDNTTQYPIAIVIPGCGSAIHPTDVVRLAMVSFGIRFGLSTISLFKLEERRVND